MNADDELDSSVAVGFRRRVPKQYIVASIDFFDDDAEFFAILAERLKPDSCRFTIPGIPNGSSPSETGVTSDLVSDSSAHRRLLKVACLDVESFTDVASPSFDVAAASPSFDIVSACD